jgi:hypothetical protein
MRCVTKDESNRFIPVMPTLLVKGDGRLVVFDYFEHSHIHRLSLIRIESRRLRIQTPVLAHTLERPLAEKDADIVGKGYAPWRAS